MRKIIILFLICFLSISLSSCNTVESDGSIMYNGIKYNAVPILRGVNYKFNGEAHKIGTYVRNCINIQIYCLNSDINENILFDNSSGAITSEIWAKEGYVLFDENSPIKSLKITNYNREEKNIELKENHNFTDIFVKVEESPLPTSQVEIVKKDIEKYGCLDVIWKYEDYIECMARIDLGQDGILYLSISDLSAGKRYYYNLTDDYEKIFREHITELNAEDNVEE